MARPSYRIRGSKSQAGPRQATARTAIIPCRPLTPSTLNEASDGHRPVTSRGRAGHRWSTRSWAVTSRGQPGHWPLLRLSENIFCS